MACYNLSLLRILLRSHSINADDTESELAAIPESPKSDSTLHGSSGGSLGELEDTVPRNALHEPRMSIVSDGTNAIVEANNRSANKLRMDSVTKPIWFLGSEDEVYITISHNYIHVIGVRKINV